MVDLLRRWVTEEVGVESPLPTFEEVRAPPRRPRAAPPGSPRAEARAGEGTETCVECC